MSFNPQKSRREKSIDSLKILSIKAIERRSIWKGDEKAKIKQFSQRLARDERMGMKKWWMWKKYHRSNCACVNCFYRRAPFTLLPRHQSLIFSSSLSTCVDIHACFSLFCHCFHDVISASFKNSLTLYCLMYCCCSTLCSGERIAKKCFCKHKRYCCVHMKRECLVDKSSFNWRAILCLLAFIDGNPLNFSLYFINESSSLFL